MGLAGPGPAGPGLGPGLAGMGRLSWAGVASSCRGGPARRRRPWSGTGGMIRVPSGSPGASGRAWRPGHPAHGQRAVRQRAAPRRPFGHCPRRRPVTGGRASAVRRGLGGRALLRPGAGMFLASAAAAGRPRQSGRPLAAAGAVAGGSPAGPASGSGGRRLVSGPARAPAPRERQRRPLDRGHDGGQFRAGHDPGPLRCCCSSTFAAATSSRSFIPDIWRARARSFRARSAA